MNRGLVGVTEQGNPRGEGIQILYPVGHPEQELGRAAEMAEVVRDRPVSVARSE
jgi:hypothetical protein